VGRFTIAATMPIAVFMGLYLRYWRPGKVLESPSSASLVVLAAFSAASGSRIRPSGRLFSPFGGGAGVRRHRLRLFASALPVWLLAGAARLPEHLRQTGRGPVAGRRHLLVRPQLELPAFTRFVDGTGPIFAGKIFPFCFITIACGAISGFTR
jgi:carbon starvation protein